ncbi:MFS phospholipid transporter Git1 [Tothia fuscella]|uniref:MFS phospholipid transporter Git1 n=1 Tax=Tothia fuscella TaxID=1048955 RepID=A0A9P4NEC2_9PEZI|nr:MFS phospholipid transporter Git1 [Tothia fuscella]
MSTQDDFKKTQSYDETAVTGEHHSNHVRLEDTGKSRWDRMWPVIACGAGLFSDGYLNAIIGSVNTMLGKIYGDTYKKSKSVANISSITFAGTVLGMLFFGYTSDHYSRKWSLMASTLIIIVFAILATGSYGAGGSPRGMFAALTAYRFLLGIGIGGEYPAGSVGCAESTGELKAGSRNKWFIMFTNVQIDLGFVIAAIVACVVVVATSENHLRAAWRICLGLGVLPPLSLLYLRLKLQEPEAFKRESMSNTKTPWLLVIKFYWFRLSVVSIIWFVYDFSAYSFGIYSSSILLNILGKTAPLWKTFAWNILINFFYMPGCILGAFMADIKWLGPRKLLTFAMVAQAIIGYIMAGCYKYLNTPQNVGGFVVVYGIFLALGELGPGNNIGLLASKTSATCIRGQYYGIAAAMGKIGAFSGSWALDALQKNAGDNRPIKQGQDPFWVASTLAIFAALLAWFCLPNVGQDTIDEEDVKFREYLVANGYDTSKMGLEPSSSSEAITREKGVGLEGL